MTVKSRLLTDRQKAVIETIRMRLTEKQSLAYLKEMGFEISPKTYYNDKRKVESHKLKRLYHIAQIGFQDQHLERIDTIELCLKLCWQNYNEEQDPYRKFQMLKDIILVQPYLSAYYEATKLIIGDKQQQSEYQEFLDQQEQQSKQEKITESIQQLNEEDVIIDDDEKYNNNNNAKF
jgi:hypothetical protein